MHFSVYSDISYAHQIQTMQHNYRDNVFIHENCPNNFLLPPLQQQQQQQQQYEEFRYYTHHEIVQGSFFVCMAIKSRVNCEVRLVPNNFQAFLHRINAKFVYIEKTSPK